MLGQVIVLHMSRIIREKTSRVKGVHILPYLLMGGVLILQIYTHYKECSPQGIEKLRFDSEAPIDEKSQKHPGDQNVFAHAQKKMLLLGMCRVRR